MSLVNNPWDNRPISNNPTQLVNHYFDETSFDIVRQVHFNLRLLNVIASKLPEITYVGESVQNINSIQPYLKDIINVAQNLSNITDLHNNLVFLKDFAPRVKGFIEELKALNKKIDLFEGSVEDFNQQFISKIQEVSGLFESYKTGIDELLRKIKADLDAYSDQHLQILRAELEPAVKLHEQLQDLLPEIETYLSKQAEYDKRLRHVEASAAVQLWFCTKCPDNLDEAQQLIKLSETLGNDETTNKKILSMVLNPKPKEKDKSESKSGLAWNESVWSTCNV